MHVSHRALKLFDIQVLGPGLPTPPHKPHAYGSRRHDLRRMFPPPLSAPYLASPRLVWVAQGKCSDAVGDKGIQLASAALLAAP